jgi:hypothetical protein
MNARILWGILIVAALLAAYGYFVGRRPIIDYFPSDGRGSFSGTLVPAGVRIRVEVLNASTVRGLARRATMYLRDRGFDVVEIGNTTDLRDSTLILDRGKNPAWAALAAKAMGGAKIELRPDTLRDVDLTVLVGATWRPPAEPFYP